MAAVLATASHLAVDRHTVALKINFPFCLFITIYKTINIVRFLNSLVWTIILCNNEEFCALTKILRTNERFNGT